MPADNTVIVATTAAATKDIPLHSGAKVHISADNLAGAEVVDIQIWQGSAYGNTGAQLTASEPSKILEGPGAYRLSKGTTAGACGVFVTG